MLVRRWGTWALWVVAAVLTVAVVIVYATSARISSAARTGSPENVVVVFSSHAEDGAQLAQVVARVSDSGATIDFVDPVTTVTIPGTSYSQLRDAYPFGGAAAVAAALQEQGGPPLAWIDVPEPDWIALLGRTGVRVVLPEALEVFDGTRLVSFKEGTSTVAPADVPFLLQGAEYLTPSQRKTIHQDVGDASLRALRQADGQAHLHTDLRPDAYTRFMDSLPTS